jgi:hypothetical protein
VLLHMRVSAESCCVFRLKTPSHLLSPVRISHLILFIAMNIQITFDSDEDPIDSIDEDEEEAGGALRQLHNLKQVRPLWRRCLCDLCCVSVCCG